MNKTINNGGVSRGYFSVTDSHGQDYVWKWELLRFGLFNASYEGGCAVFWAGYTLQSSSSVYLYSLITNTSASVLLLSVFLNHCVMAGALHNVIPSFIVVQSHLSYMCSCVWEGGRERNYASLCIVHPSLLLCPWAHICLHAFPCVCSSVSGWR